MCTFNFIENKTQQGVQRIMIVLKPKIKTQQGVQRVMKPVNNLLITTAKQMGNPSSTNERYFAADFQFFCL